MKKKSNDKIDFIIPWVDGSDPEWIKEYNKYVSKDKVIDVRNFRFRDWDNLQYWFRGVDKFAPWVNKIHFITWGHIPKWLNINHPKLNIVKHEDYIPDEYLPTFSSHPIELNMHRIKGLADKFVYFNDDIFILKPTKPDRFFKNGLPCDSAVETFFSTSGIAHIRLNVMHQINIHFSKRSQFLKNFTKWINYKYLLNDLFKTIILQSYNKYSSFKSRHMPTPYLKTTFEDVWKKNEDILIETSKSKFRSLSDVNQYLFQFWQFVTGKFNPIRINDTKMLIVFNYSEQYKFEVNKKKKVNKLLQITNILTKQKYRFVCLNDGISSDKEFNSIKESIQSSFNKILPDKSSYEI